MYAVGEEAIPLCLHCYALHAAVMERQVAMLDRQADRALDDMEMATGVPLRRRVPARPAPVIVQGASFHHINVQNSQVGVVNSGSLQQVDTAVSVIQSGGAQQLADALTTLTEFALRNAGLSDAQRAEAIEILSSVGAEVSVEKPNRKAGVARTLLRRLREVLEVGADFATVAQPAIQMLLAAFT